MNEETVKPPVEQTPSLTKPRSIYAARKTPKLRKPSKPRVIDPGIAAIHAEAKARVVEYRKMGASGRILKTIIGKRLAQLTGIDKQALFDELAKTCTPKLV
jgi:hypothetical protein